MQIFIAKRFFLLNILIAAVIACSACGPLKTPTSPENRQRGLREPRGEGDEPKKPGDKDKSLPPDKSDSNKSNIDIIIAHQNKRFNDLATIMKKNAKYHIKFPGKDAKNHALGTGIAKSSWEAMDHQKMISNITANIERLEKDYPGRIHFGYIGDFAFEGPNCDRRKKNPDGVPGPQSDGKFFIHIWGANAENFNYDNNRSGEGWGAGQATCFQKQRPGVFGISTMPSKSENDLMAKDKLIDEYKSSWL